MTKVGIIVLADVESHGGRDRLRRARRRNSRACCCQDHRAHRLYDDIVDKVSGACGYCAHAFEAEAGVRNAGVKLLDDYHGHPSIRGLVTRGFQIITF